MEYSEKDLKRMRYYLPELEEKYQRNPKSLTLRNGIAHIREVLGLPVTVTKLDPFKFLDGLEEQTRQEKAGR